MKNDFIELKELCEKVRNLIKEESLTEAELAIAQGMGQFPDAAIPHNLMGIVKEIKNDRVAAMKHFRAAYALDPSDKSIRANIDHLCSFRPTGKKLLFGDEEAEKETERYVVEYDAQGVGHIVRKKG